MQYLSRINTYLHHIDKFERLDKKNSFYFKINCRNKLLVVKNDVKSKVNLSFFDNLFFMELILSQRFFTERNSYFPFYAILRRNKLSFIFEVVFSMELINIFKFGVKSLSNKLIYNFCTWEILSYSFNLSLPNFITITDK